MKSSTLALLVPFLLVAASCGGDSSGESADGGESWCDVVTASNLLDDEFDENDPSDADALEEILQKVKALSPRFVAAAPDEIASQVERYAATNDTLVGLFADADYEEQEVDSAAFGAAIESLAGVETEIDVYTKEACGVALGPDDT